MSSPVDAPTTILSPTSVSSTGNPTLFEQNNDSVHITGGRRRKGSRKNKSKNTKRRTGSRRRTAKRTFLSKWMAIRK